jgi:hypothetical protein
VRCNFLMRFRVEKRRCFTAKQTTPPPQQQRINPMQHKTKIGLLETSAIYLLHPFTRSRVTFSSLTRCSRRRLLKTSANQSPALRRPENIYGVCCTDLLVLAVGAACPSKAPNAVTVLPRYVSRHHGQP